ncbi:MAG TPA: serine/threonine-protein kinase [Kribbella sp.]|jgi:serine/threonine protein kinase
MLIAERYRLGASLGRGGMGEVYRATDEVLGREVAVKVMLRHNSDTSAAERFQREARAAARLSDPHIVAVYDFGQYDDNFYLVMELVEGRSVADELVESGPLPWDRAINVIEQAAAGLAAAHAQQVVHRDIKPSNLLVAADGTVKVADFGIAHVPDAETNELTVTGQIMGSPHYLSPERARGLPAGPESDVYALGCVLYQLVTGRPPFTGDHPTAVLYQHVDTPPVPPSQLRPELAGPFEGVLLRMLAKDPEDRPSAAELTAIPVANEWFPTVPVPAEPVAVVPDPEPVTPVVPDRRKPLLAAAVALLVLAGAVAAGVVLHNTGDNLPPTVDVGPRPSTTTSGSTPTPSTSAPTQAGTVSEAKRTTPTTQPSATESTTSTPSATPSATPSTTAPTTTAPSSSDTPTQRPSPSPTPTKSSPSRTPSSTPTSAPPSTTDTPAASQTPTP